MKKKVLHVKHVHAKSHKLNINLNFGSEGIKKQWLIWFTLMSTLYFYLGVVWFYASDEERITTAKK